MLLSAGPFRVGDHVRLQGGPLAGQLEGVVSSLGLLYTTFATDEGSVLVPNSVVLNVALHTGRGRIGARRSRVAGVRGNPQEPRRGRIRDAGREGGREAGREGGREAGREAGERRRLPRGRAGS